MTTLHQKWRANMDKVSFAKEFPALLRGWGDAAGREVRDVIAIDEKTGLRAVLFTGGMVLFTGIAGEPMPADILKALAMLRVHLEAHHAEAYARLDELIIADRDLTRRARLENILGAIRNNIAMLPELYDEIPKLLEELRTKR